MPNEQVISEAKLHWMIFLKPIIVFIIGLWFMRAPFLVISIIVVSVVWFLLGILENNTTEYAVTNKRVIAKVGIISRHAIDINLAKVEGANLNQGIIGRLLGYGSITMRGTGEGQQAFKNIANPFEFQKAINQAVENRQNQ
jgi:uncharacterized membrane protein YdbT with pleckstrin-like domain